MKFFLAVAALCFTVSCTTLSPQTKRLLEVSGEFKKSHINEIPFIPQPEGDCGPTALTMALLSAGKPAKVEVLRPLVFTPDKRGSLPTHMTGAVRSLGMLGISVKTMQDLVTEVAAGHPVVVMQNLGLSWIPNWHYAVVVGFDLEEQVLYLHTGTEKANPMPMTYFERHWQLADHWALVILKPGLISASGDELAHLKAASALESIDQFEAARLSYSAILNKWPQSLGAHVGLANVAYAKKNYKVSQAYLEKGLELHPDSLALKNNLKVIQALQEELRKSKKR